MLTHTHTSLRPDPFHQYLKFRVSFPGRNCFFQKIGQSPIEYATMAALVIAAILIIGPTVVRSINAHFKSLEEGVQDSFREDIQQAPVGGGLLPPCDCGDFVDSGGCGNAATCGASIPQGAAPETYRVWRRPCTPLGCDASWTSQTGLRTIECREDPTAACCTAPVPTGLCAAAGGCPDEQMQNVRQCGSPDPATVYSCSPDPDCFQCSAKDPYAQWCDPQRYREGITAPTPVTYYSYGNCPSDPQCAAYCPEGTTPTSGGCSCPFANSSMEVCLAQIGQPNTICCVCDPGYVWQGSCPIGFCEQGPCPTENCWEGGAP